MCVIGPVCFSSSSPALQTCAIFVFASLQVLVRDSTLDFETKGDKPHLFRFTLPRPMFIHHLELAVCQQSANVTPAACMYVGWCACRSAKRNFVWMHVKV
jgi:hypothetical protein